MQLDSRLILRQLVCTSYLLFAATMCFSADNKPISINFLHVNDIYQTAPISPKEPRGGLARLSTMVQEIKHAEPETLFTFGGDTLSPSVESGLFKGQQMMAAWNELGVDFAVLGNHEFDFGETTLRERLAESKFPWLTANLIANPSLPAVKRTELRTINGIRVGLIGLITPTTTTLSKPGPNLHFEQLLPVARREIALLRKQGAELIVALTHCTLQEDRMLAASGLFDLILGGHDHHLVTEVVGRTAILKAGSDARDAIHVHLRMEQKGKGYRLAGTQWNILPVDGRWVEDAKVLAANQKYEQRMDGLLSEAIGSTKTVLDARGTSLRREESNVANFAADAVLAAMRTDIALLNGGGFRADRELDPGPLTRRDIMSLLPFQNPLVVLSITGEQLQTVLEYGLDRRLERGQSGAMPHVAGIRLTYDPRRDKGSRITQISVNGSPLIATQHYTLTTSNYLAGGGDGYPVLKELPVLRPAEGSPVETEVVIHAVQAAGVISPVVDGRMSINR
jgi:5'-nucleotidase